MKWARASGFRPFCLAPEPELDVLRRDLAVEASFSSPALRVDAILLECGDRTALDFGVAVDAVAAGVVLGELGRAAPRLFSSAR